MSFKSLFILKKTLYLYRKQAFTSHPISWVRSNLFFPLKKEILSNSPFGKLVTIDQFTVSLKVEENLEYEHVWVSAGEHINCTKVINKLKKQLQKKAYS